MNFIFFNGKWIESFYVFCRSENGFEYLVVYCFYVIFESDWNIFWIFGGGCYCLQYCFFWLSEGGNCIDIIKMDVVESYGMIMFVFDGVKIVFDDVKSY